ncbi:MAG: hypothetical protein V1862_13555 [Methanobacteriota archaeon]
MKEESSTSSSLIDLWFLMAGRISPQLCCRFPPPMHRAFQAAIREVSREQGDLDLAVQYLQDIVVEAPPEWMVFQQAGQLLNIIEWRRKYHTKWFTTETQGQRLKSGICGPYVAHAMALLETGADDDALILAGKIIEKGGSGSDDVRIAHLIRAAIFICSGDIDQGEEEFLQMSEVTDAG